MRMYLEKRQVKDESGMTIIEVIVAMVLLLAVVLFAINIFTVSIPAAQASSERVSAVRVGSAAMAQLTSFETQNWTWPSGSSFPTQFLPATKDKMAVNGTTYTYTYAYSYCASASEVIMPNLIVAISVSWQDPFGNQTYNIDGALAPPALTGCP